MGDRSSGYPPLSDSQVELMVRLCLRISAERGNELVLDGQWLVREDGTRTALGPLARELSLLGSEQEWIDAINHRYNVLLAVTSRGATLVGGPTDDIIARAYLQLYRSAHLPEPREEVYQREIFPGIVEMLVEDHPESYEITRAEVIAACGLQPMLNAAAANLSTVKYAVRESQHGITLFGGPSPYLGVLARDLPWVARNWLDTEPGPGGALVAVPTRRHLAIHPVTTISGFATSIGGLAHIATQLYGTEMNPVSPDVYWWHEHEYHQVTRITDAGVVRSLSPRVVDVINTLPHS